jgi:hypothetical protein
MVSESCGDDGDHCGVHTDEFPHRNVNGDDDDESRNNRSDTKSSHEEYGDPEGELDDEDAEVHPGK